MSPLMEKKRTLLRQMIKYGLVGILNTLLTATVIGVLLYVLSDKSGQESYSTFVMFIANFIGYLIGLVNSFILNRNWTFKSKSNWKVGMLRFLIVFGFCYCLQLGVVLWLNSFIESREWMINISYYTFTLTSAYICQLVGIVVYSVFNFLLNKYYTFAPGKRHDDTVKDKKQQFTILL